MRRRAIFWDTPASMMLPLAICREGILSGPGRRALIPLPLRPLDCIDRSRQCCYPDEGERQEGAAVSTSDLIFSVPRLIEFISGIMTLMPGDVIATGTPPGVGQLHKGDRVGGGDRGDRVLENSVV